MGLKASDLLGTSQVGVHLAMVGRVLFAPLQLSKMVGRKLLMSMWMNHSLHLVPENTIDSNEST